MSEADSKAIPSKSPCLIDVAVFSTEGVYVAIAAALDIAARFAY
jgi:hypothetical protein